MRGLGAHHPPKTPKILPRFPQRHSKTPKKLPQNLHKFFNNRPKSLPEPIQNEVQIQKEKAKTLLKHTKNEIRNKNKNLEYLHLLTLGAILREPKISPKPGSRYHPGRPKLDPKIVKKICLEAFQERFGDIWCQLGSNVEPKTYPKSTRLGTKLDPSWQF